MHRDSADPWRALFSKVLLLLTGIQEFTLVPCGVTWSVDDQEEQVDVDGKYLSVNEWKGSGLGNNWPLNSCPVDGTR